jgi:hypothetical protein
LFSAGKKYTNGKDSNLRFLKSNIIKKKAQYMGKAIILPIQQENKKIYIEKHYPCFKECDRTWKHSEKHTLLLKSKFKIFPLSFSKYI